MLKHWIIGLATLIAGISASVGAALVVGANSSDLPALPDPILRHLPYYDPGAPAEVIYMSFVLFLLIMIFVKDRARVPYVLCSIGLFYLARAVFQLLLPLGAPIDAPDFTERYMLYPLPYAYFPSGHVGNLVMLACLVSRGRTRILAWTGVIVVALFTFIARTHYVADALGSLFIGYAVFAFCERYIKPIWFRPAVEAVKITESARIS
jgi:hypothetical protein